MKKIVIFLIIIAFIGVVTYLFDLPKMQFNPNDCIGCSYDACPKQCRAELPRKDAVISELVEINGFYDEFIYDPSKDEMDGPLVGEKISCPRIVIVSSEPESVISILKDKIKQGSSINDIDSNGRLVANIDLSGLSSEQVLAFKKSTHINPVNLSVFRFEYSSPSGVYGCFNYLKALNVNQK